MEQNAQGTLLYDVRDTGQRVEYGARFSVTNADSSFHTDASFAAAQVDYVGLLCIRTARRGGVNQLVDGRTVVAELARKAPDVLEVLSQPFHVDQRGGVRPGEAPTAFRPVIQPGVNGPVFRYLRYWIEVGHEKAGEPLTREQVDALDLLDETLRRPDLRVEFSLRTGEILWLDNRWLLHSRTAFEDHPQPELRRHLVRLWLRHSPFLD
jgi:alpha-ketoglutarate-dependent taurine dioxygenase